MEKLNGEGSFERYLGCLKEQKGQAAFYEAVRDVCDTAYMAKVWFETHLPAGSFVGADVVALTDLILAREHTQLMRKEYQVEGEVEGED